jgi:hypothetical protein
MYNIHHFLLLKFDLNYLLLNIRATYIIIIMFMWKTKTVDATTNVDLNETLDEIKWVNNTPNTWLEESKEDLGTDIAEDDLKATTEKISDVSNSSEETAESEESVWTLDRKLTEEDIVRYKDLISHTYKNTTDENIIRERIILANSIFLEKHVELANTDCLQYYSDLKASDFVLIEK